MPHALFAAAGHSPRTRNTLCLAQRSTRGAVALARRHFHLGLHLGFGVAFGVGRFAASPPPRACALGSAATLRSSPQRPPWPSPAPEMRSHCLVTGATRPPPRSVAVAQLPPAQPHDVYLTLAASLSAPPSGSPPCALTRCPLHPLHVTQNSTLAFHPAKHSRAPVPAPYAPLPRQLRNARAAHSAPPAWHVLRNPP